MKKKLLPAIILLCAVITAKAQRTDTARVLFALQIYMGTGHRKPGAPIYRKHGVVCRQKRERLPQLRCDSGRRTV